MLVPFLDPAADPQRTGYNLNQAIIAVGSGARGGFGVHGLGPGALVLLAGRCCGGFGTLVLRTLLLGTLILGTLVLRLLGVRFVWTVHETLHFGTRRAGWEMAASLVWRLGRRWRDGCSTVGPWSGKRGRATKPPFGCATGWATPEKWPFVQSRE